MTNAHGTPIWYELLTPDPDAAGGFYDAVLGWTTEAQPSGEMDYRMIDTASAGGTGLVGGVARLVDGTTPPMMKPGWKMYLGVDDVDATAAAIRDGGGQVVIDPFDLPGVGRMAFVADPQGIAFYIMRGASDDTSTAYDRTAMAKCNWNELWSPDPVAAQAFYANVFGWTYPDRMTMPGDMGDYVFFAAGGDTIGATMKTQPGGAPPGWCFYFRAPDVEAAAERVRAHGGTVHMGPQEVPGGERVIAASDPHGAMFGVVGPGKTETAR